MRLAARVILAIACAILSANAAAQIVTDSGESVQVQIVPEGQPRPPAPPPQPQPPPGPPPNALVDYARVFGEMNETKDQRQLIETQRDFAQAEESRRSLRMGDIRREMDKYKADDPEFAKLQQEREQIKLNLDQWKNVQRAQFQKVQKEQMARLFRKIEAAVDEVAKKHKIELPASPNPPLPEDVSALTVDQVRGMALKRAIEKPAGAPDLSDEVIQLLNERYAAEEKTPTTTP